MTNGNQDITPQDYKNIGIPRLVVRGLCKHQGNILVEYSSGQAEMDRIYSLPGGEIEWGERAKDAIRRIMKDDFAMDISVNRFVVVMENKYGTRLGRIHNVELVFEVTPQTSEFDPLKTGIGARWIELNAIDRYNLEPKELREALFTQTINRRKHMIVGDMTIVR